MREHTPLESRQQDSNESQYENVHPFRVESKSSENSLEPY